MKTMMRVLACLLCIVMLLPGCSGGGSESANTMLSGGSQTPGNNSSSGQQSSGGGQQGQMVKPEQLISKEEAVTLLGEPVKDGAKDEYPLLGLNICFYAAEKSDSKSYLQIAVIQTSALPSGGGSGSSGQSSQPSQSSQSSQSSQPSQSSGTGEKMSPKSLYEGFKKLFSDPNTMLTGRIGDDAFVSAQGMSILVKEYYIYIAAGSTDPAKVQTMVKQAGELAVNNLKRIMGE